MVHFPRSAKAAHHLRRPCHSDLVNYNTIARASAFLKNFLGGQSYEAEEANGGESAPSMPDLIWTPVTAEKLARKRIATPLEYGHKCR